jgi:spore germination cell wall hydrolase CwlJ-like protein
MSKAKRTAICAALSLFAVTALSGSGAASAFGAADITEAEKSSLLPRAVYEAAENEGETPVDYTIIPEAPVVTDDRLDDTGAPRSLSQLVAMNLGTETIDREEECLAGAIYFEAKGEPLDGQLAVAKVIMNRFRSGRFPASVCGVVFQRSQFSFVRGNGFPQIARNSRSWREAVAIAKIASNDMWDSSVDNALYFHARRVSPGWRLNRIATIGNHVFYR